jgi:hypothetical protein
MERRRFRLGLPILLVLTATLVGTMPAEAARKVTLGITVDEPVYDPHDEGSFTTVTGKTGGIAPRIWSLFSVWGDPDTKSFPTGPANWVRSRGAVPLVFWEPYKDVDHCDFADFDKIADGDYDTDYVRPWAQAAAAYGSRILLRFASEINGAYFPWGIKNKLCDNTTADFKRAWKHVFNVFKSVGATNVKFLWTVSRKGCKPSGCNPYKAYYPGNAYVHYVGFSAFNWGRHSGHRWESLSRIINDVLPYFKRFTRKPVVIAELATNKTGGNKARWLRDGYNMVYKRWPNVKAIVYLNVDLSSLGHPDWSLATPSGAYPAYKSIASKAKFKGHL